MKLILTREVAKLGSAGDVVSVKDGYARNFLLPNKKALRANEANRKLFEANKAKTVARVLANNAIATLPPAKFSPMMPEPMTAQSRPAVPKHSAA